MPKTTNVCACGCGRPVDGRRQFATPGCYTRAFRQRERWVEQGGQAPPAVAGPLSRALPVLERHDRRQVVEAIKRASARKR